MSATGPGEPVSVRVPWAHEITWLADQVRAETLSGRQREELARLVVQVGHCLLAALWDRQQVRWEPVAVTYARLVRTDW